MARVCLGRTSELKGIATGTLWSSQSVWDITHTSMAHLDLADGLHLRIHLWVLSVNLTAYSRAGHSHPSQTTAFRVITTFGPLRDTDVRCGWGVDKTTKLLRFLPTLRLPGKRLCKEAREVAWCMPLLCEGSQRPASHIAINPQGAGPSGS